MAQAPSHFSLLSRIVHWLTVPTVIALFASGLWMVGLDYYSDWYQTAPNWHRSIGVLLAILTCVRLATYLRPRPKPLPEHARYERMMSRVVQIVMLVALFIMFVSGYLITTANGESLYVFQWFELPSIVQADNLEDYAGEVHEYIAWSLIVLASIHALAALKHHFIDKDSTLKRMIGGNHS